MKRGYFHGTHQRQYYLDDDLAENNGNVSTLQGVRRGIVRFEDHRNGQHLPPSKGTSLLEYWRRTKEEQAEMERMSNHGIRGQDPNRKPQPHKAKHPTVTAAIKPKPSYLGPGFAEREKDRYKDIGHNNSKYDKQAKELKQDMMLLNQVYKQLNESSLASPEQLKTILASLLKISIHPYLSRMFADVRDNLQDQLDWWQDWRKERYHEDMIWLLDNNWAEAVVDGWAEEDYEKLPGVMCPEEEQVHHTQGHSQDIPKQGEGQEPRTTLEVGRSSSGTMHTKAVDFGHIAKGQVKKDCQDISRNNLQCNKLTVEDAGSQRDMVVLDQIWKDLSNYYFADPEELKTVLASLLEIKIHPHLARMYTEVRENLHYHLEWWEEWQKERYHEDMINLLDNKWAEAVVEAWAGDYERLPGVEDWHYTQDPGGELTFTQQQSQEIQGQGEQLHTTQDSGISSGSSLVESLNFGSDKECQENQTKGAPEKQTCSSLESDTTTPPLENRIEEKVTLTEEEGLVSVVDALDLQVYECFYVEENLTGEIDRMKLASELEREGFNRKLEEANKQIEDLKETNSSLKDEYDLKHDELRGEFETKLLDRMKNKDKEQRKLDQRLEEAIKQTEYLKETNAAMKVEYDLKYQRLKRELNSKLSDKEENMDKKDAEINVLKQQLVLTRQELEFAREEAEEKIEDLQAELEVKEAGFTNSFKENEESHKEEVEALMKEVTEAKKEVVGLKGEISKARSDYDAASEILASRKYEVKNLQTKLSEKERHIQDLKVVEGEVTRDNEELRIEKVELESQLRSLTTNIESAQRQNGVLSIKITQKKRHIREAQQQVESMKVTLERQRCEIKDLNSRLDSETSGSDEFQKCKNHRELEAELDAMLAKRDDHQQIKEQLKSNRDNETLLQDESKDLTLKHAFTLTEIKSKHAEHEDTKLPQEQDIAEQADLGSQGCSGHSVKPPVSSEESLNRETITLGNNSESFTQHSSHEQVEGNMEYPCYLSRGELLESLPSSEQGCESEEIPDSEETRSEEILQNLGSPATHMGDKQGTVFDTKGLLEPEQEPGEEGMTVKCLQAEGTSARSSQQTGSAHGQWVTDVVSTEVKEGAINNTGIAQNHVEEVALKTSGLQMPHENLPVINLRLKPPDAKMPTKEQNKCGTNEGWSLVQPSACRGEDLFPGLQCWSVKQKGREKMKEFVNQMCKAEQLTYVKVPRCLKRNSIEPTDIQENEEREPNFQQPCHDQRDYFTGWESSLSTKLKSIQWVTEGFTINKMERTFKTLSLERNQPREGATDTSDKKLLEIKLKSTCGFLETEPRSTQCLDKERPTSSMSLEGNHPREGATDTADKTLLEIKPKSIRGFLVTEPKNTQGLEIVNEKMPAGKQSVDLAPLFLLGEEDIFPAPWGMSSKQNTGIFVDASSHACCWFNCIASRHLQEKVTDGLFISNLEEEIRVQVHTTPVKDLGGATTDAQMTNTEFEGLGNDTASTLPNKLQLVPPEQSPAVELQEEVGVQIQTAPVRNLGRATTDSHKATTGFRSLADNTTDPQYVLESQRKRRLKRLQRFQQISRALNLQSQSLEEGILTTSADFKRGKMRRQSVRRGQTSSKRWRSNDFSRFQARSRICRAKRLEKGFSTSSADFKQNSSTSVEVHLKTESVIGCQRSDVSFHEPELLCCCGNLQPINPQRAVSEDEAKNKTAKVSGCQLFLAAQIDFESCNIYFCQHPGGFPTLASVASKALTQSLGGYTVLGKAQGESIRQIMCCCSGGTECELEELRKVENRINQQKLEHSQKLGIGSNVTCHGKTESGCLLVEGRSNGIHHGGTESSCLPVEGWSLGAVSQLGRERSNGLEGLVCQLVGPAQTDAIPKESEPLEGQLERNKGVHSSRVAHRNLAEEKQVVYGSGISVAGIKYPRAKATRFWTDLHRCYALAGLGVGHALPWSEQVEWSQGVYPLVEKRVRHRCSPSPYLLAHQQRELWNSLGGLTPSSTQQPYGGGTHSEGRHQGNKGIDRWYFFSNAGFHDCAYAQCLEQLESAELLMVKVQSAERNWEPRRAPPDKLDLDNTNQYHGEALGSEQTRLKAEGNQKTLDRVPKSIYAQRTIGSLPGLKDCVPTYRGEVRLYPITTKDCNTQPVAERFLEMERDHSSYKNVDVNPGQTRVLASPIEAPAHLDKEQFWGHPLVELRNTELEPGLEFALTDELGADTAWTEFDRYHQGLYAFDPPRAKRHPRPQHGRVISEMSRRIEDSVACLNTDIPITKELSSVLEEPNGKEGTRFPHSGPSAARVEEIVEEEWSGETVTDSDKEKVTEPAALDLPSPGQESHNEAQESTIPVSPTPKLHIGTRRRRQLEMQASAVQGRYATGTTDAGKRKQGCKRDTGLKTRGGSYLHRARGTQNVDVLKATKSVSEHPAVFHLLQSLKGDPWNPDQETGPGEHNYGCRCRQGSNGFCPSRPQTCPSHREEDVIGQLGNELGQRKECGRQVFRALRDTFHHVVMRGCVGAKDLRKTLQTPARIYWRMLKNIGVVTN